MKPFLIDLQASQVVPCSEAVLYFTCTGQYAGIPGSNRMLQNGPVLEGILRPTQFCTHRVRISPVENFCTAVKKRDLHVYTAPNRPSPQLYLIQWRKYFQPPRQWQTTSAAAPPMGSALGFRLIIVIEIVTIIIAIIIIVIVIIILIVINIIVIVIIIVIGLLF